MKNLIFLIIAEFCFAQSPSSHPLSKAEYIGELGLERFFLEPSFSTQESTYTQGFSVGRSFLGAYWKLNSGVSGHWLIGSKSMLGRAARMGTPVSRELAMVEGYGQWDSGIGIFRMGLIPIPFGQESLKNESELVFSDTLLQQIRLLPHRDLGSGYFISHNNFVTTFAVHNGESAADEDGRYWMTGRWSYLGPAGSEYGVSASTGRHLDPTVPLEYILRFGNVFGGFHLYGLGLSAEATIMSQFVRESLDRQAYSWHLDLEHPLWNQMGLQMRYDFLEPHHSISNDQLKELSIGLNYQSKYLNSVLQGFVTNKWSEGTSSPHISVHLVWKLTPLGRGI